MSRKSDFTDSAFGNGWFGTWNDDDRRNAEMFVEQWNDEVRRAQEVADGSRGSSVARVQSAVDEMNEILEHLEVFKRKDVPGAAALESRIYDVLTALNNRMQDMVDAGKSARPVGAHFLYR